MNAAAFLVSVLVLLLAWDRQRSINWRTARAYANVQLLLLAAVGLWGIWGACTGDVPTLLWILLGGSALWLLWTLHHWTRGVPRHIQTRPADLGPPELERFK